MFNSIGDVLSKYKKFSKRADLKKYSGESVFDFISLIQSWEKVVGERLAKVTIPLKIKNNTLYILTNHSAFSSTLSFMEDHIKKNVIKNFPTLKNKFRSLYFQVNSDFFEKQMEIKKPTKENTTNTNKYHKFSPEFRKYSHEAEEIFKDVIDPECKKALESLYIHYKIEN